MSFRSCTSLALALFVSACGPAGVSLGGGGISAGASLSGGGGDGGGTTTEAQRGGPDLIVRAELQEYTGESAYRTIEAIRRRWIRPQRSSGTAFGANAVYARVVIDGTIRRELRDLQSMSVDGIERMRYVTATDATTKYGTGYSGGVIEVTTRGR